MVRARTEAPDPTRVAIARYLAAQGPTPGDDLAAAMGLTLERFWVLINHPWFEITGKGWNLSQAGRDEGLTAAG
jgi:hypothetical protein